MPRRALLLLVLMPGYPCIDVSIDARSVARDATQQLVAPGLAHGSDAFLVSGVPTTGGRP